MIVTEFASGARVKNSPPAKQAAAIGEPEPEHKRKVPARGRRSVAAQSETKTPKQQKKEEPEEEAEDANEDHLEERKPAKVPVTFHSRSLLRSPFRWGEQTVFTRS